MSAILVGVNSFRATLLEWHQPNTSPVDPLSLTSIICRLGKTQLWDSTNYFKFERFFERIVMMDSDGVFFLSLGLMEAQTSTPDIEKVFRLIRSSALLSPRDHLSGVSRPWQDSIWGMLNRRMWFQFMTGGGPFTSQHLAYLSPWSVMTRVTLFLCFSSLVCSCSIFLWSCLSPALWIPSFEINCHSPDCFQRRFFSRVSVLDWTIQSPFMQMLMYASEPFTSLLKGLLIMKPLFHG